MDKTINTNSRKVNYYEFHTSAFSVLQAAADVCKTSFPTLEDVDKAMSLICAARVLLESYNIEKANHESWLRAQQAAEKAKAEKELEEISEAFGA